MPLDPGAIQNTELTYKLRVYEQIIITLLLTLATRSIEFVRNDDMPYKLNIEMPDMLRRHVHAWLTPRLVCDEVRCEGHHHLFPRNANRCICGRFDRDDVGLKKEDA